MQERKVGHVKEQSCEQTCATEPRGGKSKYKGWVLIEFSTFIGTDQIPTKIQSIDWHEVKRYQNLVAFDLTLVAHAAARVKESLAEAPPYNSFRVNFTI